MKKKGDIWISAALYFGLGIIVITIILSAGMPVINKLRDKNTVIQTKDLMFKLDNNIRSVIRGGAGEQRYVELEIKKGEFVIDQNAEKIKWTMESRILLSQPGVKIEEGNLIILTENSNVVGEYITELSLDYSNIDGSGLKGDIKYTGTSVITGLNKLLIKNTGIDKDNNLIEVTITNL